MWVKFAHWKWLVGHANGRIQSINSAQFKPLFIIREAEPVRYVSTRTNDLINRWSKKRYLIIPVTDHAFKRTTIGYASWATDRDYEIVNEQVKPCDRHPNTESFGTQDTVCEVKGDRQRSRTRVREGECQMFTMGWQIRWCNHRLSALLVATNFSRSVFLFFLSGSLQTVFTQLLFMTKPGKQN